MTVEAKPSQYVVDVERYLEVQGVLRSHTLVGIQAADTLVGIQAADVEALRRTSSLTLDQITLAKLAMNAHYLVPLATVAREVSIEEALRCLASPVALKTDDHQDAAWLASWLAVDYIRLHLRLFRFETNPEIRQLLMFSPLRARIPGIDANIKERFKELGEPYPLDSLLLDPLDGARQAYSRVREAGFESDWLRDTFVERIQFLDAEHGTFPPQET